ncbi:MAG TPA: tRNA (adenosine(37)-N6)-threonylcarbamoyltransferase complex ATPase subunit type 1 TsaE [Firmicutes bacterium]|nr:tRNA (adenosine(37)-N6)-threonylcarbamoyltransferase complex ATPase subunit type 1 TsaE [Bacillota bacterium]
MEYTFTSCSKEETKRLGSFLSSLFERGDVVLLKGDLGAGKTTFVSGVGEGLKTEEEVISPTFNIMKCYFKGRIPMYHIDAYRLENQNIELGLEEFIEGDGVCLIEWPDFIKPLLPDCALTLTLRNKGDDLREITLLGEGKHFEEIVSKVKEKFHD